MSFFGRVATSQLPQTPTASQTPAAAQTPSTSASNTVNAQSIAALNLTAPQQAAVDKVIASFESQQNGAQPTQAQFQGLITQISRYLTSQQQTQLQQLIGSSRSGATTAIATNNATLNQFDLINGNNSAMGLFQYLDNGNSTAAPASADSSTSASLWNFGASGTPAKP